MKDFAQVLVAVMLLVLTQHGIKVGDSGSWRMAVQQSDQLAQGLPGLPDESLGQRAKKVTRDLAG